MSAPEQRETALKERTKASFSTANRRILGSLPEVGALGQCLDFRSRHKGGCADYPYRLCLGLILAAVSDPNAIHYLGGDLGLSLVSVTGRRLNLDDLIGKGDAIYDPVISFVSSNL